MATKKDEVAEAAPVKSIKAFDANLQCRGFQFEVGKTYNNPGRIVACRNGFHAVDINNPLHVWDFYPIIGDDGKLTRYAEVTQSGLMDTENTERGTKIASASITVDVEISLPSFIKRAVTTLIDLVKSDDAVTAASGDYSKLAASGDSSKLAASGHSSQLAASGDSSKLAASGHSSQLAASGDSSQLAASGDSSQLAASGDSSQLAASGDSSKLAASGHSSQLAASGHSSQLAASGGYSKLAASGDYSKLAASGDYSQLAASGDYSVIAAVGPGSQLSGGAGTHMAIAEYASNGKCVGFATGCVGKDGVEPDTYYRAENGKLVKV
jgi:hypothetical protein